MKKTKYYCIHCRTINSIKNNRCIKCKELLKPNDESYVNLVKDQVVRKGKDELFEKGSKPIRSIIKSHLYSSVLVISVIATAIPSIIVSNTMTEKDIVEYRPIVQDGVIIDIHTIEEVESIE